MFAKKEGMKLSFFSYKYSMVFKFNSAKAVAYANGYFGTGNNYYAKLGCGENCNFVSQCLKAGDGFMTKDWYYKNEKDFSLSWAETDALLKYLLTNSSFGLFGRKVNFANLSVGDLVFFEKVDDEKDVAIVTKISGDEVFAVSKNKNHCLRPLEKEGCKDFFFVQILGIRK